MIKSRADDYSAEGISGSGVDGRAADSGAVSSVWRLLAARPGRPQRQKALSYWCWLLDLGRDYRVSSDLMVAAVLLRLTGLPLIRFPDRHIQHLV